MLKKSSLGLVLLFAFNVALQANSFYPLANPQEEQRFQGLLKKLRCLVCQNQDLADSNASLAKDLRGQVYAMVQAGKKDADIIAYLTARYGDFVVFEPPLKGSTYFLWYGPLGFLLLGLSLLYRFCKPTGPRPGETSHE